MPRTAQSRALIVHPRFVHANPPAAAAPLPGADWHSLPFELLEAIAGHLDKAQDLLALSSVCRDARCGSHPRPPPAWLPGFPGGSCLPQCALATNSSTDNLP